MLHVGFAVSTFIVFKVAILGDELVRFLPLLLLQHRVSHLHVSAAELVSRQELHDAGADRVSQHVGGGAQSVPGEQQRATERAKVKGQSLTHECCHSYVKPKWCFQMCGRLKQLFFSLQFTVILLSTGHVPRGTTVCKSGQFPSVLLTPFPAICICFQGSKLVILVSAMPPVVLLSTKLE